MYKDFIIQLYNAVWTSPHVPPKFSHPSLLLVSFVHLDSFASMFMWHAHNHCILYINLHYHCIVCGHLHNCCTLYGHLHNHCMYCLVICIAAVYCVVIYITIAYCMVIYITVAFFLFLLHKGRDLTPDINPATWHRAETWGNSADEWSKLWFVLLSPFSNIKMISFNLSQVHCDIVEPQVWGHHGL